MHLSGGLRRHRKFAQIRVAFFVLCFLLASLQAWAYRFEYYMQDAVSYLDMADRFSQGVVLDAMSSAWPPMYSALIAICIKLVPCQPYWEIFRLHLINCVVLVMVIFAFQFFLGSFLLFYYKSMRHKREWLKIDRSVLMALMYGGFIWGFLCYGGVDRDSPDMLVNVFICLASGFLLKIRGGDEKLANYLALGLNLGLAYYAKGFALTVVPFFLLCSLRPGKNLLKTVKLAACAACVTTLVALPLIAEVSHEEHTLAFSSSGQLNYLWFVLMELPPSHATGNEEKRKLLIHPTRKIMSKPDVYEFAATATTTPPATTPTASKAAQMAAVTYPPHYDPAYFFRGVKVTFSPFRSFTNFIFCAVALTSMFFAEMLSAWLLLLILARRRFFSLQSVITNSPLLIVAMAIIGVHIAVVNCFINPHTGRYFSFSIVLLLAFMFAVIRLPNEDKYRRCVNLTVAFILLVSGGFVANRLIGDTHQLLNETKYPFAEVAAVLEKAGVHEGAQVAQIGDAENEDWARLPRLKIIADVVDAQDFFTVDAARRRTVLELLKSKGVQAVVYFSEPTTRSTREMYEAFIDRTSKLQWLFHQTVGRKSVYPQPPTAEGWQQVPGWSCYYLKL